MVSIGVPPMLTGVTPMLNPQLCVTRQQRDSLKTAAKLTAGRIHVDEAGA